MKCPKCGSQVFLTVITNDIEGENITSFYRCNYCKIELNENEILDLSEENEEERES